MAAPVRTTDIQTYNSEKIVCAKFTINDNNTPFKFRGVATSNDDYIFQLVARSTSNKTISVTLGAQTKTVLLTASFKKEIVNFPNSSVVSSTDLVITFPAGTYWLYHLQLERALSPSDWRPAPEDGDDYAKSAASEAGQQAYYEATSYADMTAEQKADAAVEAQTQASIFKKLTNNGQTQGIYLANGRIYINATYIQTGTLSIKKGNLETFYANADTGVIRIMADKFSLTNGTTLESTLQDANEYAASQANLSASEAERAAKQYAADLDAALLTTAETYATRTAEQKAAAAVEAQTQATIFNKLTNNGQTQGIYLLNGRIYINATYIQTGTLSIKKGNVQTFYANADTGVIKIVADEFSLTGGTTLASTLSSAKLYADSGDASTLSSSKTYSDSHDVTTLSSAKTYADNKDTTWLNAAKAFASSEATTAAAQAVNALNQATIFNKLTNNGQTQGIYLNSGKIYINAEYIGTGVLSDAKGNTVWNLSTGEMAAKNLSIISPNFTLSPDGNITATSGSFDYISLKSNVNISGIQSKIEDIVANKVTASYIESKCAVLGKMSIESSGYVRVQGSLRTTDFLYTNGGIQANEFWAGSYIGTDATIKINNNELISFRKGLYTGGNVNLTVSGGSGNRKAHVTLYFTSDGKCSPSWKSGYTASTVSVIWDD